jgi:hypothetical protein
MKMSPSERPGFGRRARRAAAVALVALVALVATGCPRQPVPVEPREPAAGDAGTTTALAPDGLLLTIEVDEALGCFSADTGEPIELVEWHSPDEVGPDDGPCPPEPAGYDEYAAGTYAGTNTPLDVWAELPDGWVLAAWPQQSPDGVVRGDLRALAGWLGPDHVMEQAFGARTLDVGSPIRIVRGPAFDSDALGVDGQPCETHGEAGLSYVFVDFESECVPYREFCGAPGLVPIDFTVFDPSLSGGCFDCGDAVRSSAEVGGYCRAPTPGWTWQCSPDRRLLVCTPPPGDAAAAALAVPPPTIPTPQEAAQQAVAEYDAYLASHTPETELAELRARLADPARASGDPLLLFLERARPAELFTLVCDGTATDHGAESILGELAGSGFFEQPLDAGQLECVERLARTSMQLQAQLTRAPVEQLRPVLRRLAEQPLLPQFQPFGRAALVVLDLAAGGPLDRTVRDLAARASATPVFASDGSVALHNELSSVLSGYAKRTADPRPLVPVLIEVLRAADTSEEVANTVQNTLSGLAGRRLEGADAWQQSWDANSGRTVDEWFAEGLAAADDDQQWSLIREVADRPPSDAVREALAAALSSPKANVRLAAAEVLARWHDRRAIPVLVRFLPDLSAFRALGWFHDRSFGFDWSAPVEEQAAAIARWREWARRLQP